MPTFAKRLTLFDLVLLATGASIGSGIFRTPSEVAAALPSGTGILLAWVLGGVLTLAGALTFAELAAAIPRAGGMYVWLSEAFGDLAGFLQGWAYFLVVVTGALAALAVVFAEYLGYLVPLGKVGTTVAAVLALVVLAGVNVVGVRVAAAVGDVLTLAKLAMLATIIGMGFFGRGAGPIAMNPAVPMTGAGLGAAMIGVLWSYGGWQHAGFVAGEAKRPERDVPLGMILGTSIVTLAYVLANVAYLRLLPIATIVSSPHVAGDAASVAIGPIGARLVAATIAVSALGTAGIYMLTAPRLYWGMAERGLFFRGVAELHPVWRTPVRAILMQAAWAIVLVLAWGTFEGLISYVLFVDWIFFGMTAAAVFVLRRRRGAPATYRVPGYPVVPAVFVAMSGWFVASTLRAQPTQALAGGALLALGVPVYRFWSQRQPARAEP